MGEKSRADRVAPGSRIGRFEVLSFLGEGGMGAVYEARDPDLDRPVALKVMNRPDVQGSIRLQREAQALARLQHPNVVAVHEVGHHDGRVYVAMERVDGVSFDRLDPAPATWRATLGLLIQAGHGLIAAHAQGLVHRDIKPHNILVSRDGRVRVADFGLARLASSSPSSPPTPNTTAVSGSAETEVSGSADTEVGESTSDADATTARPDEPQRGALGAQLTHGAVFMGTPPYMAPEQHALRPATAASDQFAFCVTVWQAIFDEHPFERGTNQSWSDAIVAGRLRPPPRGKAPGWLITALERGMAADPDRRHPSMRALISVLERGMTRRRRGLVIAAAMSTFAVGGAIAFAMTGNPGRVDACASAGNGIRAVWTADARARIANAFTAARPYGADTAERVATRIDAYGQSWAAARIDACRATHDRREQSPELLDRRMACFDRSRDELASMLGTLASADAQLVDRAIDLVGRLPDPEGCGPQLGSVMPDPDDPRAVAIRRDHLALKEASDRGDLSRARTLAEDLKKRAEELGHPAIRAFELIAYVRVVQGSVPDATIDAVLTQALNDAIRAGDRNMEAQAVVWMLRQASRRDDAKALEALLPLASATAARDGVSRNVREMEAFNTADALRNLGRFDESLSACDRLAAIEASPQADAKDCRCNALTQAVRPDAWDACTAAVAANETKYGADHIYTAGSRATLASVATQRGRYDDALALQLRVLPAYKAVFAPDSTELLTLEMNLAGTYAALRRYDEARELIEPMLEARRTNGAPPDRDLALLYGTLAEILVGGGKIDEGLRAIDEATRIHAQAMGEGNALHVEFVAYQGELYYGAAKWAGAEQAYGRCVAAALKAFGNESLLHGACLAGQADSLVELGRMREAQPLAERALAILAPMEGASLHIATARLALGRALAAAGQRAKGIAELEAAAAILRRDDPEGDILQRTERALTALRE